MGFEFRVGGSPEVIAAIESKRDEIEAEIEKAASEAPESETPHVVMDNSGAGGSSFVCLNCGTVEKPGWPITIPDLMAKIDAFKSAHEMCEERPNAARSRMEAWSDTNPMTPEEWLLSADTGVSSATIWHVMTGRPMPFGWRPGAPHDPSDFGRCFRLLARIPDWRGRMPEVAAAYPEWAALVAAWDELSALYEIEIPNHAGDAPQLYARMRALDKAAR
jgi:hypothetical protein